MKTGTRVNCTSEIHGSEDECKLVVDNIAKLTDFIRDIPADDDILVDRLVEIRDTVSIREYKPGDPCYTKYGVSGSHVVDITFTLDEYDNFGRDTATQRYLGGIFGSATDRLLEYCLHTRDSAVMDSDLYELIGFANYMAIALSRPAAEACAKAFKRAAKHPDLAVSDAHDLINKATLIMCYGDTASRKSLENDLLDIIAELTGKQT